MKLRKKLAQALRSKIGSGLLIAAMATPPIGGGLYGVDQIMDDMDDSTNPASKTFRTEMIAETNDILDKNKRLNLLIQGASDATTAAGKMDFMDKHDDYRAALLARAEDIAVRTLTSTALTEADYDIVETRFDEIEKRFGHYDDDAKLNMPGLHRRFDECQVKSNINANANAKEQAFAIRDCMMSDRSQPSKLAGVAALAGGSLALIFGVAGGTKVPQRLAERLETPRIRRRRRFGPPEN